MRQATYNNLQPTTYNLHRGMTMVEVIVWIAVVTLILLALTTSILQFYRTNKYAIEQASATAAAQRGEERVVRVIREAAYSSQGAFPVVSIAANDFSFYADVDADPLIERVRYYISDTSLVQGVTDAVGDPPNYPGPEATSTVAEHVRNVSAGVPLFRYYDETGAEITNFSQWTKVRFVKISIVTNVDPLKVPDQLTLESSAALRNLVER